MDVCVIGTGYVGLVTGVCLAHLGHRVTCVDNDAVKVTQMQAGQAPIYEPGLAELMQTAMTAGTLQFTTDLAAGVDSSTVLFIAVGTPPLPTGESDTRFVKAVARGIGACLLNSDRNGSQDYKVIVNKSTVPIGSGKWVRQLVLDEMSPQIDRDVAQARFDVVSNPEFLREGSAIHDTFNPDRIVLGGSDRAVAVMRQLYAPLINRTLNPMQQPDPSLPSVPVVVSDLASAEMIKYAANAFLATKISFINEVANICDRVGADVTQVAQGIGLDSRIGSKFLQAGIGWGGSCFLKDVAALVHTAKDYGYGAPVLTAAVETNWMQRGLAVEKLQQVLKVLKGKTVGLLGLTFKSNTDDMRDAPALDIIQSLQRLGAKVKAFDPVIRSSELVGLAGVAIAESPADLAVGCDALILVTDWPEFQAIDYARLAATMNLPLMVDGRNQLDPGAMEKAGFYYVGIGRGNTPQLPWTSLKSAAQGQASAA